MQAVSKQKKKKWEFHFVSDTHKTSATVFKLLYVHHSPETKHLKH